MRKHLGFLTAAEGNKFMINAQDNKEIAKTWWRTQYLSYRDYLIEANPFDKKSKARRAEWEAIYNGFDITPTSHPRLIDFGCGAGHFALNFLRKGFEVTGLDISGEALRILKERAQRHKLSKKLHLLNSELYVSIKELEGKFDAGYMIVTYYCIPKKDQERIFKNFVRLIRRSGKVLVMEANPLNPLFYLFLFFYYRGQNLQEGFNIVNSRKEILINLLKEAGMKDIKIFRFSFLPTSLIKHWGFIKNINSFLCKIPVIRNFAAYNIIVAVKK